MEKQETPRMAEAIPRTKLPIYRNAFDFEKLIAEYRLPDVFTETVYRWPAAKVRALQEERFLRTMAAGWRNPFYRRRWNEAGLRPDDIRNLDDIVKLPTYTSEDVKDSVEANPPFGDFHGLGAGDLAALAPLKLQTSGGTTGAPRPTLFDAKAWETQAIVSARMLYLLGARPGDVMQIPMTNSLANAGWVTYKACHDFLGVMPLTTGSGVVTSSRQQLEIAFRYGTNIWFCFPEYLIRLAKVCRDELGRDVRELKTKFLRTVLGPDLDGTLRREIEELWGCPVYDSYGANEIGVAAFECPARSGRHFMEDAVYLEVLDVETGEPVPPGVRGNLVATVFYRDLPPVIRYNTRDLAQILEGEPCACGSHFRRMGHFLGRSDAMVKLRGVNVYPMACLPAIKSDARTTGEWVCVVTRETVAGAPRDEMDVHVEVRHDVTDREGLQASLERRLKDDLSVAIRVVLVNEGDLADVANTQGREGKPRRLVDRRYKTTQEQSR